MTPAPVTPPRRTHLQRQAGNHRTPGWYRIHAWCLTHVDQHGHARAYPMQLRTECQLAGARDVSRAIRLAVDRQLLDPTSTARCLVLPGQALAPCDATHRQAP